MMTNTTEQPVSAAGSARSQREMLRPLRPVFVVGGLYSLANGVAWIMRDLAAALGRSGAPVTVCAADCWGRGAESVGHIFEPPSSWCSSKGLWLGGLSWSPGLKRKMWEIIGQADIVHNHSLWMFPNSYGSRIAARQSKPVVITAHGALEPWALRHSGWKKKLVGLGFQDRDLRAATCIHVNSHAEVAGIREYGLTAPLAVIPNGINLPHVDDLSSAEPLSHRHPETQGKRIALFMARLHEKKGLGHLIPAWAAVAGEFPEWQLVIAGPDDGFEQTARKLAATHRIAGRVTFTGGLQGPQKLSALAAADVFVQPSFSEGFSMAILEAMAVRLPVLITPGCNFPDAASVGAGVVVDADVEGTTAGIRQLLSASNAERAAMGERGRRLVEERYTWETVARQTLILYRWLISGGPQPEFVVT